jgi:gliding motility-associated lipoprotein GldH
MKVQFLILSIALLFFNCNKDSVYAEYKKIENDEWSSRDTLTFCPDIQDIQSLYSMDIHIRHADGYPFNNLFLFVITKYPDGKTRQDTVEIILADSKGRWYGDGLGDIFDFNAPFKQHFRFTMQGKHEIRFVQAMRTDPLPLIMEVGIELKKSK